MSVPPPDTALAAAVPQEMLRKIYLGLVRLPVAVLLADADGTIDFVNERFTQMTGYEEAEALGQSLWRLQCEKTAPDFCTELQKMVTTQEEWHGEMANRKKSGELYWESVSISAIRDGSGAITHFIAVKSDVTHRKQTEDRLFEMEERFKNFMENSPAASWINDRDGRYIYMSKTFKTRFMERESSWEGKSIFEVWPEHVAERLWEDILNVVERETATDKMEEVTTRSGRSWWRNFRFTFRDAKGKTYIGGIGIDLTDQKRAEEALQASERLLKAVLATLPVGVWISDKEGQLVHANQAAQDIWGGARYVGPAGYGEYKGWWLDTGQQLKSNEWAAARAIQKGETTINEEVEIESFDGSRKIIANSAIPIKNELGEITGAVTVNQDITGRKRAEQERERLLSEVQRSNQELQQFAYIASHDLQEPLRMVASYVQLLERKYQDRLDEKAATYIHHAVDGARRMQKLIDGLLNYSRISRGAELLPVDTNVVFAAAVENLTERISESEGTVTAEPLPVVQGDETQLVQLFQNLISNGLKYHKPGISPKVHVAARPAGMEEWVFTVTDNGIGINPEDHDRVFQIFQRLHTREEYPGTGIGLASCKKIIERHGGRIWIESEPGEGATFNFTLPAEK